MKKPVPNNYVNLAIRIAVFFIIDNGVGIGAKVLRGIFQGVHGAPSFVTPGFTIFGIFSKLLLLLAYLLLQHNIPTKNRFLKGFTFVFFFWATDYLPQILGMLGAHSPILDPVAFSVSTIAIDSICYMITALLLGLLLTSSDFNEKKACTTKSFLLACLSSFLIFPILIMIGEVIVGCFSSSMTCISCFSVPKEYVVTFYIIFYLFHGVSGLLFVLFYRFTQYNSPRSNNWFIFATIHGLMLWTPIVLIMIFFGAPTLPTLSFVLIMIIAIYIDTYIFAKILAHH